MRIFDVLMAAVKSGDYDSARDTDRQPSAWERLLKTTDELVNSGELTVEEHTTVWRVWRNRQHRLTAERYFRTSLS